MSVGVVGAGRWGINHVRTLHKMGLLGPVVELDDRIAASVKKELPTAKITKNLDEVLKGPTEGLVIATPVPTHFEIARKALEAGKDVLVEKPITLKSAEADQLVAIADRNKRILMVGHMLLFSPAIRFMHDYARSGKLGTVHALHQRRLNLGTARKVENALWSLGVHDVAIALSFAQADPTSVSCVGHSVLQPGIPDDVHLHLTFPKNFRTHLHASWLWHEKNRGATVVGSEGILDYDEIKQIVTLHKKGINPDLTNRDEGTSEVFRQTGEPLELELRHFEECIRTRRTPDADGRQGAAVVRVLEAADRTMVKP